MSGAELSTVLGIISSIITIIETSREIYDAATSARGLHEAFRAVAQNIPLVLNILRECQKVQTRAEYEYQTSIDVRRRNELRDAAEAVRPVLLACEANARKLNEIFAEVVPGDDATWLKRYRHAAKAVMPGKKRRVEDLMRDILEKLQLLHAQRYFESEMRDSRNGDLQAAVDYIAALPPSLPDEDGRYVHTGTGSLSILAGSGQQQNYNMSGGANNKMFVAETMNFGSS